MAFQPRAARRRVTDDNSAIIGSLHQQENPAEVDNIIAVFNVNFNARVKDVGEK